ncbi:OB-fold domain-containing protein [Bradyrhizobium sp. dw_78]|uniref:Zn-ribbon domain-containing OB-fold protein n=1 Tax=Bradyrhizobium sp. dw_78 TaxID=2719793 RepID=UPI001BD53D2C|nr:OB-fold domain-containing protein [Bradyrhizobium sp. dw_78]
MTKRNALRDAPFVEAPLPRLVCGRSRATGEIFYPPPSTNPEIHAADEIEPVEIDGTGTLLNFTRVLRGIPGLNTSFAIGLIRLDAGPVLTAPLVDWEDADLRSGARVALVIGEIKRDASGNTFIGPKFRPA